MAGAGGSPGERPAGGPAEGSEPGFALKLGSSGRDRDYLRIGAGVVAAVLIFGIALFSFTDLSAALLPMEDRYLEILLPRTEEGVHPVALNELTNLVEDNRISITGRMTNASLEPVENVVAVITARETTGRFPETIEVPVEPPLIEPGESGTFSVAVTLRQRPDTYTVRFRLQDGPFVPHSDERGFSIDFQQVPGPLAP